MRLRTPGLDTTTTGANAAGMLQSTTSVRVRIAESRWHIQHVRICSTTDGSNNLEVIGIRLADP